MRFNNYIWSLFRESKTGKASIARYEAVLREKSDRWLDRLPGVWSDSLEPFAPAVMDSVLRKVSKRQLASQHQASELYENLLDDGFKVALEDGNVQLGGHDALDVWLGEIQAISLALFKAHPEYFAPYLFRLRFNRLNAICDELEIAVPVVPGKASWRDRALFYMRLNESLQEFRRFHALSPEELCALLYDFAPQHLAQEEGEMPAASKVWFLMGGAAGPEDFDFLDAADKDSISHWQGNVDTRRGDILIMWCVSPRSYVHSIWRAESDGFIDPMMHYHSMVWICSPTNVPHIPFKELAADPVWSEKPAVKAHFQGASGKAVTVEEYDALLRILKRKGCKISGLPRVHAPALPMDVEVETERDVEELLLEPLLHELGYGERDWIRNMPVRMGRGERVYPDYAIGAKQKRGEESAQLIVEAKRDLSTSKQLREAYLQAKSYAQRLQAQAFVLTAREGIWIFQLNKGTFSLEQFTHKSWEELRNSDSLHEVKLSIGKKSRLWSK